MGVNSCLFEIDAIMNMAKDAKRVYPHAVSLIETLRAYGQMLDLVENNKELSGLLRSIRTNECE